MLRERHGDEGLDRLLDERVTVLEGDFTHGEPDIPEGIDVVIHSAATVSFDPARDRPAALAKLRDALAPRSDWRFLTAADEAALEPVLADYGQEVDRVPGDGDAQPAALGHVLKVFLVDSDRAVRNVYSSGFLDHRLVLRDVETLRLEASER